jgi:hypothetical protein
MRVIRFTPATCGAVNPASSARQKIIGVDIELLALETDPWVMLREPQRFNDAVQSWLKGAAANVDAARAAT